MNRNDRHTAFTFAEIMVAAPWAYSIIAKAQDNDEASMLQRNIPADDGSSAPAVLALEETARAHRAAYLTAALRRLGNRLATAWQRRTGVAHART
jgi:hypothetical protein